jgi:AraC family transcriptional regulator, transcriptional activator of pobA
MPSPQPHQVKTISAYHALMGLPKPEHPLISVVNFADIKHLPGDASISLAIDFYSIALKRNCNAKMKYGQQPYDFDEGLMTFIAPGQVYRIEVDNAEELTHSGWLLLIQPDFLWNTPLAKTIRHYDYFGYSVKEALLLSDKEETTIAGILRGIEQEYHANLDAFGQRIIIAQLEVLLAYAERFYHRQFLTRKITNHQLLQQLETVLADYFTGDTVAQQGLPSVQYVADALHVSPNYLSGLLKVLTGQSTQQHIHDKLLEKAKEKLSTTTLTVSEIAYALGFEHPQSLSKLFKTKTNQSPLQFRQSFN